jgi:hypothetical protein
MLVELEQPVDLVLVEQRQRHCSQRFGSSSRCSWTIAVAEQGCLGLVAQLHFEFIKHFVNFGEFEKSLRNLAFDHGFIALEG